MAEIFKDYHERRRECVYYLALGNYKLGNYAEARRYNDLLREKEPGNLQAQSLQQLIDDKVMKGGISEFLEFRHTLTQSRGHGRSSYRLRSSSRRWCRRLAAVEGHGEEAINDLCGGSLARRGFANTISFFTGSMLDGWRAGLLFGVMLRARDEDG